MAQRKKSYQAVRHTQYLVVDTFIVGLEIQRFPSLEVRELKLTSGTEGRIIITCFTPQMKFSEIQSLALDLFQISFLPPARPPEDLVPLFGFSVPLKQFSYNISF